MKYNLFLILLFSLTISYSQTDITAKDEIKETYFKAERLKIKRNYSEAIKVYSEVVNKGKSKYQSYAYMGRGVCKSKLKQYQAAIIDFDMAISVNNKNHLAYSGKARALNQLKQHEEALFNANESTKLNSTYPYSFFEMATALKHLEEYDTSVKILDYAIKNLEDPKNKKYKKFDLNVMYFNRGVIKVVKINQKETGCKDIVKAKELGQKGTENVYKLYCN